MLASVLIISISVILFCYWFRYTCMLILSTKTSKDYSGEVATANQLHFLEVQGALREESGLALDRLMAALDRDYQVLSYLLRQAPVQRADSETDDASLEQYVLRANFWAMRAWYRVSRQVSQSAARSALQEMSLVVSHFANSFGERIAQSARA
jgi:hypothetical protein